MKTLTSSIFILFSFYSYCQNAVLAGGFIDSSSEFNITYSIGQSFYQYDNSELLSVTAGVNQVYQIEELEPLSVGNWSVSIYPNPAIDKLFIENTNSDDYLIWNYELVNNLGQVVIKKNKINHANDYLDLSILPTNTYYLRIYSNNLYKTFKIFKNK